MGSFEKIRKFNLYYLALISFLVAYGRGVECNWISIAGKHLENILLIPVLLTVLSAVYKREYRWPITFREKIFAFYALYICLMPVWGLYLDKSLDALREFWAAATFAALIMYNLKDEKDLKLLVFSFIGGATLGGFLSILEYLKAPRRLLTADFRNQNAYGMFLSAPLSLIFALFFYFTNDHKNRTFLVLAFFVSSFALLFTKCRAALLSMFLAVAIFSVIFNKKAAIFAISVTLLLASFITLSPNSAISKRIKSIEWKDTSLQIRIQGIWPSAIAIYRDHNPIIGTGSGAFPRLINEAKYRPAMSDELLPKYHAHNQFLQALVSQGIIGAAIYLFFIFQIGYLSWHLYKFSLTPFTQAIGVAGLLWIFSNSLAGIVHHEFRESRYNMGAAFMVTIVLLSFYLSRGGEKK